MTLIVGVLCEGGIVVGADGAATLGGLGGTTARQPVRKLVSVNDRIILGVSGPVGLAQLFEDRVFTLGNALAGSKTKTAAQAMRRISAEFKEDVMPAIKSAQTAAALIGQQRAALSALCSSLVALSIRGEPTLIQFDHQCQAEAASPDLPFVAIGSGQSTADPFLALIRRVFWPQRLPNVAEGTFAVLWTLHQAIETSPGGVTGPEQIMVLQDSGVRELDESEFAEHRQNVTGVEDHLAVYANEMAESSPSDLTVSPPPETSSDP